MLKSTRTLLDEFKKTNLGPTRVRQNYDGKCSLIWNVDDDDDRYVEVTDSLYSPKVVMVARDGYCEKLESTVLSRFEEILGWVRHYLEVMSHVQSPRGRPAYKTGWFQTRGVG